MCNRCRNQETRRISSRIFLYGKIETESEREMFGCRYVVEIYENKKTVFWILNLAEKNQFI